MLGVESAFQFTDKVLTVSIHYFAEGFYPGTGSGISTSARSKAAVNIPMKTGLSDETLNKIFDKMIEPLVEQFSPDAIVLQCGVDGECSVDLMWIVHDIVTEWYEH
jgi:acetoin utilization deacetylase AcuC-like enzyme